MLGVVHRTGGVDHHKRREHRELVAQGIPPILHKQVEGDTLHILHQGAAILNLSRLEDRTA